MKISTVDAVFFGTESANIYKKNLPVNESGLTKMTLPKKCGIFKI